MSDEGEIDTGRVHARGLLLWLWRTYLRKHWLLLIAALLFMSVEGSMLGLLSYMMKPMFDQVFVEGSTSALKWVGFAFLGIFVLRGAASVAQKYFLALLNRYTIAEIRLDLVRHLMRLDLSFHQDHPPGHLMQRVEGDVGAISTVWGAIISGAGRDVIAVISLFGVALSVDWAWTLVALIGVPLLVLPSMLLQRLVRSQSRLGRDLGANLSVRLNEMFHGIVPVKLNGLESYQADRYNELTRARIETEMRATLGQAGIPGMIDAMSGVGFLMVLLYGGGEIISGEKTVGDFMAFFTAIGLAFEPLRRLGAVSGVWQSAAARIERIRELLSLRPALVSPEHPLPPPGVVPEVRLDAVQLTLGDTHVLRGLSFTAEAGKTTALVGPSGAGKTTVFNLLTRLYDPQSGAVSLSGIPVSMLRLEDLRGLFSVVSQDALLFDDTLRENILLGRNDMDDAALAPVLADAHVADFLDRLPAGLDTQVGTRGSNLSGGQRQRVAIARALLRDTPVLLLDEATSALDTKSEAVVQQALDRLSHGRTTLVIAHRLSTVRNADKIVVMDQGRVVDEGTHDELLARGGLYADLYQMQFSDEG
ncbi:ABC transporter ATP-binding protein [Mesobacterium pallidum]|uniref:ABC transporter ATP-binding protein n=1 Tax=Mesobacterium pallidum TaxID=2872037 RepID=UPI001EE23C16|nr:ABC transporter ATP-binding protein [Mesobacterium pallidum]